MPMKRQFCLLISIIISFHLFGQTGTIIIKKQPDTINIIGQWIKIYDKNRSGKIIKAEKNNIDTLFYFPDNKFLQQPRWGSDILIWSLDQKKREIKYDNVPAPTIVGSLTYSWTRNNDFIGIATQDTLTILHYYKEILEQTSYYIRKK